ncbi:MAG TPA: DNA polymerase ligase N-terminal domain-containing protein [Candidatus Nanoarchaeia archaeon]|nr:DNA polymerase ligase N-terminal domain-containing protein [Candidatus Nanoarchaeia archaeon]
MSKSSKSLKSLKEYKNKRNLSESNEPKPKSKKKRKSKSKESIFVIQKHDATNLHYDLRLEMNGVLKSWAVPKKPPKQKGTKRLAIQTEDHPLEYAKFQGRIPEGHYGAGEVEIWDKGDYELIEHQKDKKIEFKLKGKKLEGKYVLVKTKYGSTKEQKEKSWLFFKVG